MVVAFLKLVPTSVWVGLAAAITLIFVVLAIDRHGYQRGVKEIRAEWDADKRARERSTALANAKLAQADWDAKKRAEHLASQLAEATQAADAARAALAGRKDSYVALELTKFCPDVPRGYLLWRTSTAAFANGADLPAAPDPTDLALQFPSGVSLATLGDTDLAQSAAYRTAIEWGNGWRQYALDVKTTCEAAFAAAKGP